MTYLTNTKHLPAALMSSIILFALTLIIFNFPANSLQQSYPVTFNSIINVSNSKQDSTTPQIAVSGNNVYVVWVEDGSTTTSNHSNINFKSSIDNGASFGNIITLSYGVRAYDPEMAVSGSNVYVVWIENDTLYFKRSTDNGASFGNATILSNEESHHPQIAVSGNNVYVVWEDANNILYTRSTDYGVSFERGTKLTNVAPFPGLFSKDPQIAVSGNNVYVVWSAIDLNNPLGGHSIIQFKKSTNNGANLGNTIDLSSSQREAMNQKIAVSGNNVYVVWEERYGLSGEPAKLFIKRSINNGASFENLFGSLFGSEQILSSSGGSYDPEIAVSGSNVHILWNENFDVIYIRSTDNGATFENKRALTNQENSQVISTSGHQKIAVSGNNVYVVWEDHLSDGKGDIYIKKSPDNGAIFESTIKLTNKNRSDYPQVAASRQCICRMDRELLHMDYYEYCKYRYP